MPMMYLAYVCVFAHIVLLYGISLVSRFYFFFFNDTATTEIYTLSLHDALPICSRHPWIGMVSYLAGIPVWSLVEKKPSDRKSTRLNSSHLGISYAVFCLKKKKCWSSS